MRTPPSSRERYSWLLPLSIRWRDMDALGHVNNASYLTYSESARIAFFDQLFGDDPEFMAVQGPILAEVTATYHEQLSYPGELEVGVRVESIGNSSFVVSCPVFRAGGDKAVTDMRVVLAWFDYRAQRTVRVPDRLRDYHAQQSTD